MTTGVTIMAMNNEAIDYVAMARWSADRVHRHLDLPVCLITDRAVQDSVFDQVIVIPRTPTQNQRHFDDIDGPVTWYNNDRLSLLDLTPWDHSVILDADYVVASDRLRSVLDHGRDIMCHTRAFSVSQPNGHLENLNSFGSHRMPMLWATVMLVRKTAVTQQVFQLMQMIRDNWRHYCNIYGIGRSVYRNDFALTIAYLVAHGHVLPDRMMPWDLVSVMPDHRLQQTAHDEFKISWTTSQSKERYIVVQGTDFHAMCKASLGEIVADPS